MIVKKFDQGWHEKLKASILSNEILKTYFRKIFFDNSKTVLVNNTWAHLDFSIESDDITPENNKFLDQINEYIKKNTVDNVIIYNFVDPVYPDISIPNTNVIKIGYYPYQAIWIDFHAILISKYFNSNFNNDYNLIDTAFMCHNGKPHPHREELVSALLSFDNCLVKNNFVSFGGNEKIPKISLKENYQKTDGYGASFNTFDGGLSLGDTAYWSRHFLNVVTETVFDVEEIGFWSEKIFKPIIGFRPFLVYAPYGAINLLKKHGFENYCNEFGDISDLDLTIPHNIPKFLNTLNSQGKNYYQHKYCQLEEKIKYNQNRFWQHVNEQQLLIRQGYKNS